MSCVKRLTFILVAAGALMTTAVAQMPRNAFLNKPALSVSQLIQQFKNDPVVQKRFMKHYGASKERIIRFFSTLRTGKLAKTGYYKVYNIDKLYMIRSKLLRVRAGTHVFFTPEGRVALIRSCGNPTDVPIIEIITPRYLIENPVVPITELVPPVEQPFLPLLPEEVFLPEAIVPPIVTEFEEKEVIVPEYRTRRSWFPIPIPIPFNRTRTRIKIIKKDCPVIPGPAAAISFGVMAFANRRRRRK